MAMLFCGLLGQSTGLQVVLPVNDIQEILGSDRAHRFGQFVGMTYFIASPFILTGPIITGILVDRFGINVVGIWSIAGFCAGAVCLFVSVSIDDIDRIDSPSERKQD